MTFCNVDHPVGWVCKAGYYHAGEVPGGRYSCIIREDLPCGYYKTMFGDDPPEDAQVLGEEARRKYPEFSERHTTALGGNDK